MIVYIVGFPMFKELERTVEAGLWSSAFIVPVYERSKPF
jgi:hypothetical protein